MTLTPSNYAKNSYSKSQTDNLLNEKQDTLVSGTNIKTVNGVDLLGSGDVVIGEGGTITIDQTYNSISTNAQSGTAVADALKNSMESVSANGTISNCILEIPQNIKLELSNNVLTLKAGSILTCTGSTYATYTTTVDKSLTISSATTDGLYIVFADATNVHTPRPLTKVSSGDSNNFPIENLDILSTYYNTDDKLIYRWNPNTSEWITYFEYYPICLLKVKSGVASFAKDANDNNIIFNGAGFIGHHAFTNIQVKELASDGYNDDGSLKNIEITTNAFIITEMLANPFNALLLENGSVTRRKYLGKFKTYNDIPLPISSLDLAYIINDNILARYDGTKWVKENGYAVFVEYSYNGTTVTDFTIRQPYEGARYLLTDEIEEEVATKQADLTTVSGYDATKTQTLKNVSGVLTWVDD